MITPCARAHASFVRCTLVSCHVTHKEKSRHQARQHARLLNLYETFKARRRWRREELVKFARGLEEEEKRCIAEGLNEEELSIFDLLTRPEMRLTKKEEAEVKKVAKDLLLTLKEEKLVIDWRKRQQTRAQVYLAIEETLDRLPGKFTKSIFQQKCQAIYLHVYESYFGPGKNVYSEDFGQPWPER